MRRYRARALDAEGMEHAKALRLPKERALSKQRRDER